MIQQKTVNEKYQALMDEINSGTHIFISFDYLFNQGSLSPLTTSILMDAKSATNTKYIEAFELGSPDQLRYKRIPALESTTQLNASHTQNYFDQYKREIVRFMEDHSACVLRMDLSSLIRIYHDKNTKTLLSINGLHKTLSRISRVKRTQKLLSSITAIFVDGEITPIIGTTNNMLELCLSGTHAIIEEQSPNKISYVIPDNDVTFMPGAFVEYLQDNTFRLFGQAEENHLPDEAAMIKEIYAMIRGEEVDV